MKTYTVQNSSIKLRRLSQLSIIKPGDWMNVLGNSWNLGYGFIPLSQDSCNLGHRVYTAPHAKELGIHFFRPI